MQAKVKSLTQFKGTVIWTNRHFAENYSKEKSSHKIAAAKICTDVEKSTNLKAVRAPKYHGWGSLFHLAHDAMTRYDLKLEPNVENTKVRL